jgi:hypothetical protein
MVLIAADGVPAGHNCVFACPFRPKEWLIGAVGGLCEDHGDSDMLAGVWCCYWQVLAARQQSAPKCAVLMWDF